VDSAGRGNSLRFDFAGANVIQDVPLSFNDKFSSYQ
jgi:hypothetical protein